MKEESPNLKSKESYLKLSSKAKDPYLKDSCERENVPIICGGQGRKKMNYNLKQISSKDIYSTPVLQKTQKYAARDIHSQYSFSPHRNITVRSRRSNVRSEVVDKAELEEQNQIDQPEKICEVKNGAFDNICNSAKLSVKRLSCLIDCDLTPMKLMLSGIQATIFHPNGNLYFVN